MSVPERRKKNWSFVSRWWQKMFSGASRQIAQRSARSFVLSRRLRIVRG